MIKHIIFDWDGTLVNTVRFLKISFEETFSRFNITNITYQYIRETCAANPDKNIFELVFAPEIREEAKQYFYAFMRENHLKYISKRRGAEEILAFCRSNNIKCYIQSAKDREILRREIEFCGWTDYFVRICGSGDYVTNKNEATACTGLFCGQIPPAGEMLVLGDGASDVEMARTLGCPVIIVKSYGRYVGRQPDYKLRSLKDFVPLLQTMLY